MKHLIHRQTIEISAPTVALAHQWEMKIQELLSTVITPVLDESFSANCRQAETIVIDEMHLDLGIVNDGISKSKIYEALQSQLNKIISRENKANKQRKSELHRSREQSGSDRLPDAFLFYLESGFLPWWASNLKELSGEVINEFKSIDKVKELFETSDEARSRLARFFTMQIAFSCLAKIDNQYEKYFRALWAWLEEISISVKINFQEWRENYILLWLDRVLETSFTGEQSLFFFRKILLETKEVYRLVFDTAPLDSQYPSELILRAIHIFDPELIPEVRRLTENNRLIDSSRDAGKVNEEIEIRKSKELVDLDMMAPSDAGPAKAENYSAQRTESVRNTAGKEDDLELPHKKREAEHLATGIIVQNAGIVLLFPFLAELFKVCGLRENDTWRHDDCQSKSVALLTYLGYGKLNVPEYSLLIEKFLCGMPWSQVYEEPMALTVDQKSACEELLNAVIKHWKAVGNISHDGLREGFLQRTGMLSLDDRQWKLNVENKTVDILLIKIPWGYSYVRLSWMPEHLKVAWS